MHAGLLQRSARCPIRPLRHQVRRRAPGVLWNCHLCCALLAIEPAALVTAYLTVALLHMC